LSRVRRTPEVLCVEEAQNVYKKSRNKPGSEIWVSFNPELDSDDPYKRFVISSACNSIKRSRQDTAITR
jgi:phage terminase large subunit